MSTEIRQILESLERGEIGSQEAIRMMRGEEPNLGVDPDPVEKMDPSDQVNHYLRVDVHRLHDDKRQVHVKVPLRILELGLKLGSKYTPELGDVNINQFVDDLHAIGEGTIVEVEDINDDQHVLVWIEKG